MTQLIVSPAWQDLKDHKQQLQDIHLMKLYQQDEARFNKFSYRLGDLFVDLSKNHITSETINLLVQLAEQQRLSAKINALFNGELVNATEQRPALHMALRDGCPNPLINNGADIRLAVHKELERITYFVNALHQEKVIGVTGKTFTDIVNIGVGGSSLGTELLGQALKPYQKRYRLHCISAVDGEPMTALLASLNPETTLFIVASKSFRSIDTMINANTARDWLTAALTQQDAVKQHFVGVSANLQAMTEFGIQEAYSFQIWDWVGGRYSIWSAIGLPIAIAIGMGHFNELLLGAKAVDEHFLSQPLAKNVPVLLALIDIWYQSFWGYTTRGIFPYTTLLQKLPSYLQQLTMESLGKSVTLTNETVDYQTGAIIWGDVGFLGQHAFFQLLHQGTHIVPADFIAPIHTSHDLKQYERLPLANLLAQTRALMAGIQGEELVQQLIAQGITDDRLEMLKSHQYYPGNRPSTTILFPKVSPRILGSLLAMYEHRVFTKSAIWNINPFDQWGVELGKSVAKETLQALNDSSNQDYDFDGSTKGLLAYIQELI